MTTAAAPAAPAASGGPISLTLWGAEEDQALLAERGTLEDPNQFIRRMNQLLAS